MAIAVNVRIFRRHRAGVPAYLSCVAAVLVAVAGCGSEGSGDTESEPTVVVKAIPDMATFALPLDPYRITLTTQGLTLRARSAAFRTCMEKFGFALPDRSAPASKSAENARRYGVATKSYSALNGYHYVEPDAKSSRSTNIKLTAAQEAVANGTGPKTVGSVAVPEGGCSGEANRVAGLDSSSAVDERLADKLAVDSYNQSKADSRVQAVFAQWSECMKAAGFQYTDPMVAIDDPQFAGPEPTANEIKVAVTDIECKEKTNLLGVWGSVEAAYQQRSLEKNSESLEQARKIIEQREASAAKILGTQG